MLYGWVARLARPLVRRKLARRAVTIGRHDPLSGQVEVLSGLADVRVALDPAQRALV